MTLALVDSWPVAFATGVGVGIVFVGVVGICIAAYAVRHDTEVIVTDDVRLVFGTDIPTPPAIETHEPIHVPGAIGVRTMDRHEH